jgi:G3E family GTPase
MDPLLREVTVDGVLCDVPGAVAMRHDLFPDEGQLHRTVYDTGSVLEDERVSLEHACLTCAIREDVLPALQRLVDALSPAAIVLALPVTADPQPMIAALTGVDMVRVAAVASVFDPSRLDADLLGTALLVERGLAFTASDRRAFGEALAHQVEAADALLVPSEAPPRAAALLDHLVDPPVPRRLVHDADGRALVEHRRTRAAAFRGDLMHVAGTGAAPREGVWTLDLQSWRPFHPQRLLDHIQSLGAGRVRGRGHFWLPTRPHLIGAWDGAGGQLSIGAHGHWTTAPETHLVITGTSPDPDALLTAFDAALMDDAELAEGLSQWRGRPDGLDAWLGEQRGAA